MKLVETILNQSKKTYYFAIVFLMTVFESIFLFIPPEVFITPSVIADKKKALPVVISASLGSIIGGVISYLIGFYLFDSVGIWLIENFSSLEKFEIAKQLFIKHGVLIILITAFTPVPYKLMAISAGFIGYPVYLFIGISAIFRTGRFAIIGILLYLFQEKANIILKKYFLPITLLAIAFALIGFLIITFL